MNYFFLFLNYYEVPKNERERERENGINETRSSVKQMIQVTLYQERERERKREREDTVQGSDYCNTKISCKGGNFTNKIHYDNISLC